jgi:uncharacterized membrane protein
MRFADYAIIVAIGLLSAAGQYLLKVGITATTNAGAASPVTLAIRAVTNPSLMLAGVAYVVAFAIYLLVLAKSDVSQIFPVAIGVNVLCVALMAALILGEAVTMPRLLGMVAIVMGVYVVTRF